NGIAGSDGVVRSDANDTIGNVMATTRPVPSFAVIVAEVTAAPLGVPEIRPFTAVSPFGDGLNVTVYVSPVPRGSENAVPFSVGSIATATPTVARCGPHADITASGALVRVVIVNDCDAELPEPSRAEIVTVVVPITSGTPEIFPAAATRPFAE